jgi:hypothetical protein
MRSLTHYERRLRLLAVGMAVVNQPVIHDYRCEQCRKRCRSLADLVEHEAAHRERGADLALGSTT